MLPPFPSYINSWRNDVYPSIDPTRPELSHAGQTIVVTGASTGIGTQIAKAYAAAGAAKVAIIARRADLLKRVKADIEVQYPKTRITFHVADVTDTVALKKAARQIGTWNVLVMNAGYMSDAGPVTTVDVNEWWKAFEVNVLGVVLSIQAFAPTKAAKATYVGINSGVITMPGAAMANYTSYKASKMALTSILEVFAHENPDDRVHIVHPGVIVTDMMAKSGETGASLPQDDEKLPAQFIVWSTSPEGAFTSGKFTWANWDVDALIEKKQEFTETPVHTTGVLGWPYGFGA